MNPTIGIEDKLNQYILPTKGGKRICVVGGGPAGMQATIYLSDRGHQVTLFEAKNRLGGSSTLPTTLSLSAIQAGLNSISLPR